MQRRLLQFFDFPRYKDWTHVSKWAVDPADAGKRAADLVPGDRLRVDLGGMSFRPTLVVRDPGSSRFLLPSLAILGDGRGWLYLWTVCTVLTPRLRPQEITRDSLTWDGSIGGLLVGRHKFAILPSVSNPGGATLRQREDWLGPLSVPFRLGPKQWSHGEGWTRFNEDIKKEAESRAGSGAR